MHLQALVLLSLLLSFPLGPPVGAAKPDQWKEAMSIVSEGRELWEEVFTSLDVNPKECEAIIFPELMRYSRVRDGMEQAALLALYAKGGVDAANFSVGIFQMKPSFAEQVEKAWMKTQFKEEYNLYFDTSDNENARKKRVSRLREDKWQCVYLAVFVRLVLEREQQLREFDPETRIKYLATAYNWSFTASMKELKGRMNLKAFHLDVIKTKNTRCFSYSDLAAKYYRQRRKEY